MIRKLSLSRRAVAWLCALLLAAGVLPMYALALYNHAFYDDFGFSLLTRNAWQSAGSVLAVLEAAVRNTVGIRQTWEGTYATSFLSTFQPAVFGEGAYWVTTFLLLTVFLLAVWFFLRQTLKGIYGMDRASVTATFGILGFVLVQFVPDAAEAFYWFNGGVAYTLLWAILLLWAGVWLRLERAAKRSRAMLTYLLLLALTVLVGGGKYSTVLFALLLALCFTGWAFLSRRPRRWAYLSLTVVLCACLFFSASAPGNGVRAQTLSGGMSAPKAVLEAVYFGLALIGHSVSLPLLAALALMVPLSAPALRQSGLRFAHPLWATGIAVCLFCAQLAPTLYTGNYLGDGRVLNTYYYTFVIMAAQLTLYWTGWCLRRGARGLAPPAANGTGPGIAPTAADAPSDARAPLWMLEPAPGEGLPSDGKPPVSADGMPPATANGARTDSPSGDTATRPAQAASPKAEQGLRAVTLAVVAGMLLLGSMAFRPDGAQSYGPQNMAGGSALRALVNGQAAAYDQAMDARDAMLNDPALAEVTLTPVADAPASFMGDALTGDNLDYVLSLYAEYYHKATVRVAETEADDAAAR
ncbi:MAG: hypothetical protein GX418_10100 [Clostridiales bacterium]|nr:hypothetical protein [Clostridiales bacterium]